VQKDIIVNGVTIKRGDFMVYSTFEAHMNPNIYSNPTSFEPERYLEDRGEDKKEAFCFMGWGVGRVKFECPFEAENSILHFSRASSMCWGEDRETGN
jgi:cytochrome P450